MENRTPFVIRKDSLVKNCYFNIDILNGFRLFSVIPLDDGTESIYIIDDPSKRIDTTHIDGLINIDMCLRQHFKYVNITYEKNIEYPYSIEYIKATVVNR